MIEALFGIVTAIVEAIVTVISALIEFIAGFFTIGAETLTAGEAVIVFLAFVAELVFWLLLWLWELILALFQWRKPKKVPKPILYKRKSKQQKGNSENDPEK